MQLSLAEFSAALETLTLQRLAFLISFHETAKYDDVYVCMNDQRAPTSVVNQHIIGEKDTPGKRGGRIFSKEDCSSFYQETLPSWMRFGTPGRCHKEKRRVSLSPEKEAFQVRTNSSS